MVDEIWVGWGLGVGWRGCLGWGFILFLCCRALSGSVRLFFVGSRVIFGVVLG